MKCTSCGTYNPDCAKFCHHCGNSFRQSTQTGADAPAPDTAPVPDNVADAVQVTEAAPMTDSVPTTGVVQVTDALSVSEESPDAGKGAVAVLSPPAGKKKKSGTLPLGAFVGVLAGSAVLLITAGIILILLTTPTARFKRYFERNELARAAELVIEYPEDEKLLALAAESAQNYVPELFARLHALELTPEQANGELALLSGFYDTAEAQRQLDIIAASRAAYAQAEAHWANGELEKAVDSYRLVDAADLAYFDTAQARITEGVGSITRVYMEKADEQAADQQLLQAYRTLEDLDPKYATAEVSPRLAELSRMITESALKEAEQKQSAATGYYFLLWLDDEFVTDEVEEKKTELIGRAAEEAVASARKLLEVGEAKSAYRQLSSLDKVFVTQQVNTTLAEIKTRITNDAVAAAEALAKGNDYAGAVSLLDLEIAFLPSNTLTIARTKYVRLGREYRIGQMKAKFTVKLEEKYNNYCIYSKGDDPKYVNLNTNDCLQSSISVYPSGTIFFELTPGYVYYKDINMDCIWFDCDGEYFKWYLYPQFIRKQTLSSSYAEWYNTEDGESNAASSSIEAAINKYNVTLEYRDLKPLIEAMRKSDKVKVYFSGSGDISFTLREKDVQQALDMWELYQLLLEDPTLIELLK